VEEINLENNDGKDCHSMKEEFFQDVANESRISDGDKEKYESIFKLKIAHTNQDNLNHEKKRIDYIESWFQSIVGQAMQSYFGHIQLILTSVYFGHAFHFLIKSLACSPIPEFILEISWMLEWINWKSTYTIKVSYYFK
jgi:hypothetical protein